MSTKTKENASINWDFARAIDLLGLKDQTTNSSHDAIAVEPSPRRLGDFSNLWTYLGAKAPDLSSQASATDVSSIATERSMQAGSSSNETEVASSKYNKKQRRELAAKDVNGARKPDEDTTVSSRALEIIASQRRTDVIRDFLWTTSGRIRPSKPRKKAERRTSSPAVIDSVNDGDGGGTTSNQELDESRTARKGQGVTIPKAFVKFVDLDLTPRSIHNSAAASGPNTFVPIVKGKQKPKVVKNSGLSYEFLNAQFIAESKLELIKMLQKDFPANASLLGGVLGGAKRKKKSEVEEIHVFVDMSNIKVSFKQQLKVNRGIEIDKVVYTPKINFHALSLILERGRSATKRFLVGSYPLPEEWEASSLDYTCHLLEPVNRQPRVPVRASAGGMTSGSDQKSLKRRGEQGVDEILNMHMLESLIDEAPATMVLASGDAAEGEFSAGFLVTVERALSRGWKVEVASFSRNLSRAYKRTGFRDKWKAQFRVIELDEYAELLVAL